jgi:uncharacterized protein YcbX
MTHLSSLHCYPIKSARGHELERARVTPLGLADDRRFMVSDLTGRFLSQRERPRLALLAPELASDHLSLRAPGRPELRVPLLAGGVPRMVRIWRDEVRALDLGDEAADWLNQFLGSECRLIGFDPTERRASDARWCAGIDTATQFADAFPILVIGRASLDDLNHRLAQPVPMNRFRPNLVIDGLEPFAEDRIDVLQIGAVQLKLIKACTRCITTTTDQLSGERQGDEPLRTLKSYRYDKELSGVTFGQNALVLSGAGAELVRGARVTVIWKPS